MIYKRSLLGRITSVFRRICTACGHADPVRSKLRKGGRYASFYRLQLKNQEQAPAIASA